MDAGDAGRCDPPRARRGAADPHARLDPATALQPRRLSLRRAVSDARHPRPSADRPLGTVAPAGAQPAADSRPSCELGPELTAFFTRVPICASSAAVSFVSAKATGHMVPSSRPASGWKPNVAYLTLNFEAAWKKQITLPSFAYAGIP